MKTISEILSVKFQFLVVRFSIYLNRRVFVLLFFISSFVAWAGKAVLHDCDISWLYSLVFL